MLKVLLAVWLLWAASAGAVTVPMMVVAPCTNDDSLHTPLTDLMAIDLYMLRCGRSDTLALGSLDAVGRECDTLYFDLGVDSIGTTYDVFGYARDTSNNRSWRPAFYGLAVAAREFDPGLLGAYYNRMDFTQFCGSRIDGPIDFDWSGGSPLPCVTPYDYSVEWTGKLRASIEGIYTVWLDVNGGARLWVNGSLLIDRITDVTSWTQGWTQYFDAGSENEVRIAYVFNWQGSARVRFSWTPPGGVKATVPLDALVH